MRGIRCVPRLGVAFLGLAGLLLAGRAGAQIQLGNNLPRPRLTVLTPCGGKVGGVVEVGFSGTDLEEPQGLLFSHPGIKGEPIIPPLPPPPKVDPKSKKPAPKPAPRPPITKFKVTIGKDVPPGLYDARFVNKWGVSNPRIFVVGDLEEVTEKEPNNDIEQAQRVELGTTINGTMGNPTDVDYLVFQGKKGQRVIISCLAASIDSRLMPELRLFDGTGRQLDVNRPVPQSDSFLDATLPEDGDYYLRLCQFTYTQGGGEHFYRLNISTGPWIDLVFPPMVEAGKATPVTVYGRNLPGGKLDPSAVIDGNILEKITVTVNAPKEAQALQRLGFTGHVSPISGTIDGFEYRLSTPAGTSNPFLLTFARAPVVLERDDNDTPETAQEIPLPVEVAGKIDKRRDRDWFVFNAKKGAVYMIELFSHRLGSPTDMYFSLRNLAAKQNIVNQDDSPAPLNLKRFHSAHRDPLPFRFVAPADGKYHLLVASHLADSQADPHHYYRLRITPEAPDFRLIVMPADDYRPDSLQLGQGGSNNYVVLAERHDGFKGEITLAMDGLPTGVTCLPQVIGPNMKEGLLVVSAGATAPVWTGEVKVTGTATINGAKVVREARPATITWPTQPQQNIPALSRLDRNLMLAVRDKAPYRLVAQADKSTVTHGNKVNVKLTLDRIWPDNKAVVQIQLIPNKLPPNVRFPNVTIPANQKEAKLVLDVPVNTPPGTYSIVFQSFAPVPFSKDPKAKKKGNVNVVLPSTPITLNILPKEVAKVTVPPNFTAKLGKPLVVPVTLNRLHDYEGSFKLELVLPAGAKGLGAEAVTVPAGQNAGKLIVNVEPNTPPGNRPNLTIRATAVIQGNVTLIHEAKTNINVVK